MPLNPQLPMSSSPPDSALVAANSSAALSPGETVGSRTRPRFPSRQNTTHPTNSTTPLNGGLLLGIGIGVLVLLAVLCICVVLYLRRRRELESFPPQEARGSSRGPSGLTRYTYDEVYMATGGFSSANLLGQGGFGQVYQGVLPSGRLVAIKLLKATSLQGEREFRTEIEVISRVHHRNLISLVGHCIEGTQRMLVYEFAPNRTLDYHLHGNNHSPMVWPTRMKVALGSARGLAYLHDECNPRIIHRDVKASNILLDFNFEAKVADFGLAKIAQDTQSYVSTQVKGTFGYLDPEYANSGKLTEKSDVFSFGVLLLELISGRPPVDQSQPSDETGIVCWARPLLAKALQDGKLDAMVDPSLPRDYNKEEMTRMLACAAACIRHSARHRPPIKTIVQVLEGSLSMSNLEVKSMPGSSMPRFSSLLRRWQNSDYDTRLDEEDSNNFRMMALEIQGQATGNFNGSNSEDGPILKQWRSTPYRKNELEESDYGRHARGSSE